MFFNLSCTIQLLPKKIESLLSKRKLNSTTELYTLKNRDEQSY